LNYQFENQTTLPEIISNSVCSEEQAILSLLEVRSDIDPHTHKQLINLLNSVKRVESFQYSLFKETLNLVNFTVYDINYFKRALNNNINKGYVRPTKDHVTAGSQQKEMLPNWYDDKKINKGSATGKKKNEDYQQTKAKIEIMLEQLRGQMA
jgi:hypothetical protein